jgi:hypothetical protein
MSYVTVCDRVAAALLIARTAAQQPIPKDFFIVLSLRAVERCEVFEDVKHTDCGGNVLTS